jgi:hypothetical protein
MHGQQNIKFIMTCSANGMYMNENIRRMYTELVTQIVKKYPDITDIKVN